MKIVHVYKDFDPPIRGGMERHIALMCQFQRQWAEVEALVCGRRWQTRVTERNGTRVVEAGEWGRFQSAPFSPSFPWLMRHCGADILVVHAPNPTAELGYLIGRPPGTLVVRYHSDVVRQASAMRLYKPLQMQFLRQAAMILPTSAPYLDSSPTLAPVKARCRVVPLGILPEMFENPEKRLIDACRTRYGSPFVLFAGMHRYYKGLPYLIRAAKLIQAPLVLAGDGPERLGCERLARELGVTVHFPGVLSDEDLSAHLHACAVFAFPSVERSEAFGISIMEAHACGKPVVATRLGTGVEFINEDGKTGYNVVPRNPEALAEAINRLLADETLRETMGAYARERIYRDFHAERVARQEFELYLEAASC